MSRAGGRTVGPPTLELTAAAILVAATPALLHAGVSPPATMLLALAMSTVLGAAVWWRWDVRLPITGPWPRVVIVAVALFLVSGIRTGPLPPPDILDLPVRIALAVLAVPGLVGGELFLRGALYSRVEDSRGTVAAVLVASAPVAVGALLAPVSMLAAGIVIGVDLVFGLSRSTTGTLAPALVARLAMGVGAAVLLLFVG